MVRDVYPPDIEPENEDNQPPICIVGDVVYGADEPVPADQPCLKCKCQPPGVHCETVQCAKKAGCKAIHRPNKCCPDYQCECQHEGKIYANGERVETHPGGECKVCYCRGGEIQCAEVSCYIRNDCEGKRVPGTCCPKYDHCPPIDPLPDRTPSLAVTESNPGRDSNVTENENLNKVPDTSAGDSAHTVSPSFEEVVSKHQQDRFQFPRITIQEIIPERKEIPITAPPKIYVSEPQGTLLIEEALPTNDNDLNVDAEPESSEVSEVFQHPPPVLRIGDKLLFLKKGDLVPEKDTTTPHSVITIIGAEGLQRGGVEDSLEVHEVKIEPETVRPEETNDLELKSEESTHILSLVMKKKDRQVVTTTTTTTTTTTAEPSTTLASNLEEPNRTSQVPPTLTIRVIETAADQNPEYPPLPDVMPSQKSAEPEQANQAETVKILPDVLELIGNGTRNETQNSEWLKTAKNESLADFKGDLPEELLNEKSPIDVEEEGEETEDPTVESSTTTTTTTTTEPDNAPEVVQLSNGDNKNIGNTLKEVAETTDSGEQTTPKSSITNNPSALVVENKNVTFSETHDMTSSTFDKEASVEVGSQEEVITASRHLETMPEDVELISTSSTETSTTALKQQEMDPLAPTKSVKIETSTYELLPTPEETKSKTLIKREIVQEGEEIFKQLERELGDDEASRSSKSKDEERAEAESVFKQLLEETEGKPKGKRTKEQEEADRLSDAVADVTLKGRLPGVEIFKLIDGFLKAPAEK